jgi:hypothetical protein
MIRKAVLVLLLITLGYGIYLGIPLIQGPSVVLNSPQDGQYIEGGLLVVSGKATRSSELKLNGRTLLMDTEGNFATSFVLPVGSAIITLTAHDRMERSITLTRTVFATLSTTTITNNEHGKESSEESSESSGD